MAKLRVNSVFPPQTAARRKAARRGALAKAAKVIFHSPTPFPLGQGSLPADGRPRQALACVQKSPAQSRA